MRNTSSYWGIQKVATGEITRWSHWDEAAATKAAEENSQRWGPYRVIAPEVPATNDPVAVARNTLSYAATALEASADNGDQYCASQIRAALAEVPADEGTLRERLAKAARVVGDGNGSWSVSHEHSLALADALMPAFATELQKARAEVEDWFWRNSESTVQDHIRFNSGKS